MDKEDITKNLNLEPILAVIKKKELLIALLLMVCLSILTAHNLKIYVIGLIIFLLTSRLIGHFQLGNLFYLTAYNSILTCVLFGVVSAIIINLIP